MTMALFHYISQQYQNHETEAVKYMTCEEKRSTDNTLSQRTGIIFMSRGTVVHFDWMKVTGTAGTNLHEND